MAKKTKPEKPAKPAKPAKAPKPVKASKPSRTVRDDDDDDRGEARVADPNKPRSDAYVGLLAITLVAVLAGAVLMFLDHSELEEKGKAITAPVANTAQTGLEFKTEGPK